MNRLVINLGLARCGTTATEDFFKTHPGFTTPTGVKELKFFLRAKPPEDYIKNFQYDGKTILFESSPPYMHSGPDTFDSVLDRIVKLRDIGFDIQLLVNIRSLVKRAFSHYWHDINGHYSIFGRAWGVSTLDDPRRFKNLYQKTFLEELSNSESRVKFLPEIGQMLVKAIDKLGEQHLRLVLTSDLDSGISHFISELLPDEPRPAVSTRQIPGTSAPTYLYGGDSGTAFELLGADGFEMVQVPAHTCVLLARRHKEVLSGRDHDLKQIVAVSQKWTRTFDCAELPASALSYLEQQQDIFANIPSECFLSKSREDFITEIGSFPKTLNVRESAPNARLVQNLIFARQSLEAERDGKVMVGRGGRLFLHHDMNQVMAQHTGELQISDQDVQAWSDTLHDRTKRSNDQGVGYFAIFAPDTHAVYREEIEVLDYAKKPRPIIRIMENYTGANLFYPLEVMRAARRTGEPCHFTDSHWSAYGAFVAYREILQKSGIDVPILNESDLTLADRDLVGDLGAKFDPPRSGRTTEVILNGMRAKKVWNNGVNNRGHMSLWIGKDKKLPKALLITDSYGWKLQQFLAQSFSELFIVHSPIYEQEAIDRFSPDYVFSLLAERFAYKVPNDHEDMSAIQNAVAKNPGTTYPDFDKIRN